MYIVPYRKVPNCGTAACIAGWACAIDAGENPNEMVGRVDVDGRAMWTPRLTMESSDRLFILQNWPEDLRHRFAAARTLEERAQIAADRIDLFIESDGMQ